MCVSIVNNGGPRYDTITTLIDHVSAARKKYPDFEGLKCVLREIADLIKAEEHGNSEEIKRQAMHVAVTAVRLYEGD